MKELDNCVFERIALAVSGGGFRAAAYGLGTLNALHVLGVLENVHILSTISGGTITGAYYSLRRKKGDSFEAIYEDLYEILEKDEVLAKAIGNWEKAAKNNGENYKLIRAFSDVYNEDLYSRALFDAFWQPDPAEHPFHLQSVIFSATELHTGIAFRFQYASHLPDKIENDGRLFDSYFIGNGNVTIPRNRAREIRLADIVAASSCFPVGFEPLVLPNDFFSPTSADLVFLSSNGTPVDIDRLGLIDGGIYDNQGIEAIIMANRRNAAFLESTVSHNTFETNTSLKPSTLLLIADVASAERGIYEPPGEGPIQGKTNPIGSIGKKANRTIIILMAFVVVLTVAQLGTFYGGNFFFGLLAGLALTIAAFLFVARILWIQLTDQLEKLSPKIYRMAMPVFLKFTFQQWGYLLKVRLMTMIKLLLSVFLRRVRSLNYGLAFQNNTAFAPKAVISSIIGGIIRDADRPVSNLSSIRKESRLFLSIIKTGSEMGTTLWWLDDKRRMQLIVVSAEITLLYRILLDFEKRAKRSSHPLCQLDQQVYDRANLLWQAFVLSQDSCQPSTYLPNFRLHPSMAVAVSTPGTLPADLIAQAKLDPFRGG